LDFHLYNVENVCSRGMNLQGRLYLKPAAVPFQAFSVQFHDVHNLFRLLTRTFQSNTYALLLVSAGNWFSVS